MTKTFHEEGIETDTVQVGNRDIRGCIACGQCARTGKCVFDDIVNELADKQILARILKYTIKEFQDMGFSDIMACINNTAVNRPKKLVQEDFTEKLYGELEKQGKTRFAKTDTLNN